jgi:serine/threonine protein phosphatase PrpC
MEIEYWAATDVGRKRTDNEDNYLIDKDLRLFIVADGMGGHASGEVASAMAVHTIREMVIGERDLLDKVRDDQPGTHMEVCTLLEYAVHIACERIFEKARQEPEKRGMGTTVVALLLIGSRGYIAYVGDSRIYLLRGGIVYQLTEDHSLMNELVRRGKIRPDEFDDSPYANFKNAMTRAVGPHEIVEVDTLDFDMLPGDAFLLCTDGLYEYLDDHDISRGLALPDVRDIPRQFVDLANTRGGKDNVTALVIKVPEDENAGARAAELNFTLDTLKQVPIFKQLSYQQLVRIMNMARIIPMRADQVVCREGESGQELYVVLKGSIRLESGGTEITVLPQGSHFGEMALIDSVPRSVTAIAVEDGKLLSITRTDFFEILRKEAPLAVKLLWSFLGVLADRLRRTTADLKVARDEARMEDLSEEVHADLFEA